MQIFACYRMINIFLVLLIVTTVSIPSHAETGNTQEWQECAEKDEGITAHQINCAREESGRLELIIGNIIDIIEKNRGKTEAHNAKMHYEKWKNGIYKKCENDPMMGEFEGGSYATVIYNDCVASGKGDYHLWIRKKYHKYLQ